MDKKVINSNIQKLLFAHPFYERCGENESAMNICVIGDTDYARAFVDYALSIGQMPDKRPVIYWCISSPDIKSEYLAARPALSEYVDTDGCIDNHGREVYANIHFMASEDYMGSFADDCRYIFAATADDEKNCETAMLFKLAVNENCLAAYVCKDSIEVTVTGGVDALENREIRESYSSISDDDELERMAFNTHRIWEGSGNRDYDRMKERFAMEYNHDASVAFVLSIPYKLRSIGIRENNSYEAAEKLQRIIDEAKKKPKSEAAHLLNRLAALEHRRWVLEKVTQGAVGFITDNETPDYLSCVSWGRVKEVDESGRLKRHPCIVRSSENSTIDSHNYNAEKWNKSVAEDRELDELDLMSVQLHRVMYNSARAVRTGRTELDDSLERIRRMSEFENDKLKNYFDRYFFCIENILDESLPYSSQYETYEKMLIKEFELLGNDKTQRAKAEIKKVTKILFPVLESNMYRDYKKYDVELMTHIPFILTGKHDVCICMPLGEVRRNRNNNDEFFKSVASATALYADKIVFLFTPEYNSNLSVLQSKLKAIRNYFEYRGKNCEIILWVIKDRDYEGNRDDHLKRVLRASVEAGYINGYDVKQYDNTGELITLTVEAALASRADFFDGTAMLVNSPSVNGRIVQAVSKVIPYFEFDSYNKHFENCVDCEFLNYGRISTFIQVEDMFALMNATDKEFNYQNFGDIYMRFWDVYTGDGINEADFYLCARSWTKVCGIISFGGLENMSVVDKPMGAADSEEERVIRKMLNALQGRGFLRNVRFNDTVDSKGKRNVLVSLKITERRLKDICAKAGDLLEIYVYFEACKTGWFDDVQTGYKFRWEFDEVTNELDCVLTKDYRSILVECKSTKNPDENFFLTLDSLGDHFGIGYKKVLIMVTDVEDKAYDGYLSRGRQMDIIVISKKEELLNIGSVLKSIMEKA